VFASDDGVEVFVLPPKAALTAAMKHLALAIEQDSADPDEVVTVEVP